MQKNSRNYEKKSTFEIATHEVKISCISMQPSIKSILVDLSDHNMNNEFWSSSSGWSLPGGFFLQTDSFCGLGTYSIHVLAKKHQYLSS